MKILVIDDERPIRSLMKEILDDEGHVTDIVTVSIVKEHTLKQIVRRC